MKKITKILTASLTAFVMGASSVVAYADTEGATEETGKTVPGSSDHGVYVNYEAANADTVYSVDVAWGSMEFTYTESGEQTWDPETHTYTKDVTGEWTWEDGDNEVTVTNHSNAQVNVLVDCNIENEDALDGVTMTCVNTNTNEDSTHTTYLNDAVGTDVNSAPSATFELTLDGTPTDTSKLSEDFTKVATLTVELMASTRN